MSQSQRTPSTTAIRITQARHTSWVQHCGPFGTQYCGVTNRKILIERNTVYGFSSAVTGTAGIRSDGSTTIRNNIVYGVTSGRRAIYRSSYGGDSNETYIYHNTVDPGAGTAIETSASNVTIENNIGDATVGSNAAYNPAYFVNAAAKDYHLVVGSAPHDSGTNLGGAVGSDFDGKPRSGPPDQGAYELQTGAPVVTPDPPTNVHIVD